MAKRRLTDEEQSRLAEEAERAREEDGAWDFANPKLVTRGAQPTAVLSVRLPLSQFQLIRETARRERMSVSELLQAAVLSFLSASGATDDRQSRHSGPPQRCS